MPNEIEDLFLNSAHNGDLVTLEGLWDKVADYGKLRGVWGFVSLFDDQLFEFIEWNALLLALFQKHSDVVSWLVEEYQNQHLRSLLSEPLSNSEGRTNSAVQRRSSVKDKLDSTWKHIRLLAPNDESLNDLNVQSAELSWAKHESFALRVSISNRDMSSLLYLWEKCAFLWDEFTFLSTLNEFYMFEWVEGI